MNEQIFISIPLEQFKEIIKSTTLEVVNSVVKKPNQETEGSYLTRQQVAKQLHLSLTTLDTYTKEGLLTSYKIGHRVLYKKSDLDSSLLEKISSVKYKSK